jgi:translation initiation factor 2B subunit (eIF-2B alpha/beta/delta family)
VARLVCRGQPAMAPLWNLCAAAVADFELPGRYARRRAEAKRAPRALIAAATSALSDALLGVERPRILTHSYSSSVAQVIERYAAEHSVEIVCGESLPGGEGADLRDRLSAASLRVELVEDARLTTFLPSATAVVIGADAVGEHFWINKAGSYGLAAAASFSGIPVYVVASRDKAASQILSAHLKPTGVFERIPAPLATLFLTEAGAIPPEGLGTLGERFSVEISHLIRALRETF